MPGDTDVRKTHLFRRTRCWALSGVMGLLPLPVSAQSAAWPEFPSVDPLPISTTLPQRPAHIPPASASPESSPTAGTPVGSFVGSSRLGPHLTMFPAPPAVSSPSVALPPLNGTTTPPGSSSPPNAPLRPAVSSGLMPERAPKDFGRGWKTVVTRGPVERDRPAASLAAPKSTRPRPAWGWHGYDSYQTDTRDASSGGEWAKDLSAELAPFMKYAHRWRPSSVNTAYGATGPAYAGTERPLSPPFFDGKPSPSLTVPTPAVTRPVGQELPPRVLPSASQSWPASSESLLGPRSTDWVQQVAASTPTPVPAVTFPVDASGRPMIQPTSYRQPEPASAPPRKYIVPLTESTASDRLPSKLQEKVTATCAGKCRGLSVEILGSDRLCIRFRAKDQLDADLLTNMLGSLPELAPYRVEFEVQIGP